MQARVLFADDQAPIRELFSEMLRRDGLDVISCGSAREACQLLAAERFDLVITDMRMETERAGYEVIRTAQELPSAPPLLLLTAFPIRPADLRGYQVAAIIMKGTDVSTLLAKIRNLIKSIA